MMEKIPMTTNRMARLDKALKKAAKAKGCGFLGSERATDHIYHCDLAGCDLFYDAFLWPDEGPGRGYCWELFLRDSDARPIAQGIATRGFAWIFDAINQYEAEDQWT